MPAFCRFHFLHFSTYNHVPAISPSSYVADLSAFSNARSAPSIVSDSRVNAAGIMRTSERLAGRTELAIGDLADDLEALGLPLHGLRVSAANVMRSV